MNGHFAAVGNGPTAQQYEHGIQVIDEDKAFKFVKYPPRYPLAPGREEGRLAANQDFALQHESQ